MAVLEPLVADIDEPHVLFPWDEVSRIGSQSEARTMHVGIAQPLDRFPGTVLARFIDQEILARGAVLQVEISRPRVRKAIVLTVDEAALHDIAVVRDPCGEPVVTEEVHPGDRWYRIS
jgi:hypothetical protein